MRIRRILLAICIIISFLWNGSGNVLAMNTGFSTENMAPNDQQIFLSNINLYLITEEPKKSTITCFDVNDNGLIVVGSEGSTKKSVSVYTSDGTFNYGYAFNCSGSFGVEWDDNNIIIYFVRSDVAALFDAAGTNLELKKIQDTTDNNSYWNHSVYSTQRTINEEQYSMRNNMGLLNIFASSYSQLIKTNSDGNTVIIYDASSEYTTRFVTIFIAVILFVAFIVLIIILQFKKLKKR